MICTKVPYKAMTKSQYMTKYGVSYVQATALWAKLDFLGLAREYRSSSGIYKIQPTDTGLVFSALAGAFPNSDVNKLYAFSRRWITYSIRHGVNRDIEETVYSVVYSLKADYRHVNNYDVFGETVSVTVDRMSKLLILKVV